MIQHVKFISPQDLNETIKGYNIANGTGYFLAREEIAYKGDPCDFYLDQPLGNPMSPEETIDFILENFPDDRYFEEGEVLLENIHLYYDYGPDQYLLYWEVDDRFV